MLKIVYKDGIEIIVEVIGEREIFIGGELYKGEILSIEDDNAISKIIDSFEDGMNRLNGEYEVYEFGKFRIQRKVRFLNEC